MKRFKININCMILLQIIYWRASREPAAAVIPAPIVSMIYVAIKKSVVFLLILICF